MSLNDVAILTHCVNLMDVFDWLRLHLVKKNADTADAAFGYTTRRCYEKPSQLPSVFLSFNITFASLNTSSNSSCNTSLGTTRWIFLSEMKKQNIKKLSMLKRHDKLPYQLSVICYSISKRLFYHLARFTAGRMKNLTPMGQKLES